VTDDPENGAAQTSGDDNGQLKRAIVNLSANPGIRSV
jgi:hypothetical protein